MLVIVEYRDITALLQALLNLEASRCRDVLQVDPAEASSEKAYCLNDIIDILAPHTERDCIHTAKLLEQHTFSFHDRHSCFRPDIAESQHCRSICNNCHRIPASRQLKALADVLLDLQARLSYSRCVGKAQRLFCIHRRTAGDFDFPLQFIMHLQ